MFRQALSDYVSLYAIVAQMIIKCSLNQAGLSQSFDSQLNWKPERF